MGTRDRLRDVAMTDQPAAGPQSTKDLRANRFNADSKTSAAIIAAAREEFIRYGVRRANVERIGRRASVSRVTVYRQFENKAGLLRAVITNETSVFVRRFDEVWFQPITPAKKIEAVIVLAVDELRHNPVIQSVRRFDPEEMLRQFTFDGEHTFEMYCSTLAGRFDALVTAGELNELNNYRAAEVVMRLFYTFLLQPYGTLPGSGESQIREFAREFIVPIICGRSPAQ
jgi:AcrR family transcriptional regulator